MKTISIILFIVIVLCNIVPRTIAELKLYLHEKKIKDRRKEDDEQ